MFIRKIRIYSASYRKFLIPFQRYAENLLRMGNATALIKQSNLCNNLHGLINTLENKLIEKECINNKNLKHINVFFLLSIIKEDVFALNIQISKFDIALLFFTKKIK